MRMIPISARITGTTLVCIAIGACGSGGGVTTSDETRPRIVVTTDILGDIVSEVVDDLAMVEVIMPSGASPHEFRASASQAETMENADLLIINGAGFEAGMTNIIETIGSGGTSVFTFADAVELRFVDSDHDDDESDDHDDDGNGHSADAQAGEEHEGEPTADDDTTDGHGHDAGGPDPHIWTDPEQISSALDALEPILGELDGLDATLLDEQVEQYQAEIETLITEMEQELATVPPERRVLVTDHEVFGYFADRFDFRVAGAIIPSLTTNAQATAAGLDDLVDLIDVEDVPAIFVESTQPTRLADAIAAESSTDVQVVELFSESLGMPGSGADTYLSMMRTNTSLMTAALSS